jgi:hypothetical protein
MYAPCGLPQCLAWVMLILNMARGYFFFVHEVSPRLPSMFGAGAWEFGFFGF